MVEMESILLTSFSICLVDHSFHVHVRFVRSDDTFSEWHVLRCSVAEFNGFRPGHLVLHIHAEPDEHHSVTGTGTRPATDNVVKTLKKQAAKYNAVVSNSSKAWDESCSMCSICQDKFENSDNVVELGCHHVFHVNCAMEWLKQGSSCPTCRFKLTDESVKKQRKSSRLWKALVG